MPVTTRLPPAPPSSPRRWSLLRVLTWGWGLAAVLAGLEWLGWLGFATPAVGTVVRGAVWLLILPASFYLRGGKWVAAGLWGGVGCVGLLGVVTILFGGLALLRYLGHFFGGADAQWTSTQVHARRGSWLYVTQESQSARMFGSDAAQADRQVVQVPATRWFTLYLPAEPFDTAGWTPVHRPAVYFSADSTRQLGEDQARHVGLACERDVFRLDSLDRRHQLPAATLPAATRTGAGVVGCRLQGRVWSSYLDQLPRDCPRNSRAWAAPEEKLLVITAWRGTSQCLRLRLPFEQPTAPGTYPARVWLTLDSVAGLPGQRWESRPGSAAVTIALVDTRRHLLAGTFVGTLYPVPPAGLAPAGVPAPPLPVSQGRFDVPYATQALY